MLESHETLQEVRAL